MISKRSTNAFASIIQTALTARNAPRFTTIDPGHQLHTQTLTNAYVSLNFLSFSLTLTNKIWLLKLAIAMAYQTNAYSIKHCTRQPDMEVIALTVNETRMAITVRIACSAFIDANTTTNALIASVIKMAHWVNNAIQLANAAVNQALLETSAIDVCRIIMI